MWKKTELHDGKKYAEEHKVPIVSLKLEITQDDMDVFSANDGKLGTGDKIIAKKYSDGSRKTTTSQGREIGDYADPVKQAQHTVKKMREEMVSLTNQYSKEYESHFKNEVLETTDDIINKDLSKDQLMSYLESLRRGVKNIPEENEKISNIKNEWNNRINDIHTIVDNMSKDESSQIFCPPIVYHSVFDTIADDVHINSIDSDDHRTFRNLLEISGIEYERINNMGLHDQSKALDSARGTIRGQVNELWEQKEVDFNIRYSDNKFSLGIKDTAIRNGEKSLDRLLKRPSDRSKGFQWFLSFYINLRAETNGLEDKNQLILLDDPAVFLHPEGKKNWLESIEKLSENAQIIYSSHSPFLIKKEYPNRIRIVEDRESDRTVVTDDFHTSDKMSLEPLRSALGIGLGDSPFVSKRKILVEGGSDYYILTGLANYYRDHLREDILSWGDVTIMPTNGGDNMIRAAKWVASEEFSYALLLDNDEKGEEIASEIKEHHHEIDEERTILLKKDDDEPNSGIEIEDMFHPEFYIHCVNSAYEEQFDDFERLEIEEHGEHGEHWNIEGHEYEGWGIVNIVEDIFDDRGLGDLDKILVASEIRDRLTDDRNVSEGDVEEFKNILGEIRKFI